MEASKFHVKHQSKINRLNSKLISIQNAIEAIKVDVSIYSDVYLIAEKAEKLIEYQIYKLSKLNKYDL